MEKLLVILGPTATGKTDLAMELAKKYQGELVAADSRQVYKGLDLGTGKMPGRDASVLKKPKVWLVDGVPIWMYDLESPNIQYTVAQFLVEAVVIIKKIHSRNHLPIVVGGTGLYIWALLYGLSNLNISSDPAVRQKLETLQLTDLQKKITEISPQTWENLNNSERNNKRRLIRQIELITNASEDIPAENTFPGLYQTTDILQLGLSAPREILNLRIDQRVESRVAVGMIEEGERLHKNGLSLERMDSLGLEYREMSNLIKGQYKSRGEMILNLQNKIHQYAKRQMTWFKRDKNIDWFDITDPGFTKKVEKSVSAWYNKTSRSK